MKWRALQEGQIYIKQNLSDEQIDITDIQKIIVNKNNKMINRIMKYREKLYETHQFWMTQR